MENEFCWNFNELDEIWFNDTHGTIEECIAEAVAQNEDGRRFVYVGECVPYKVHCSIISILEDIATDAIDQCGEVAEDWEPYDLGKDGLDGSLDELENAITDLVVNWLSKKKRLPVFSSIKNVKKYPLPEAGGGGSE